jgi:hypothetical protein
MALTRIKNKALSSLLDANEDVNSANLDNVPASDNASALTTGTLPDARLSNQVKVVKATSAPGSSQEGDLWYDTTNDLLKVYDTTVNSWFKIVRVIPTLSSIGGGIENATAGNLTLNGDGFLSANLVVSFTPSGGSASNVTVTPSSDTAATVAIPSAIYNLAIDTVIAIVVTNEDGKTSAGVNRTVMSYPTGGTITTSGNYRIHTFNSSGNFTNTIASLSVEYLIISGGAGGGAGGGVNGNGGGGGGGLRSGNSTLSSVQDYAVVIGAGGAGTTATSGQANGSVSSFNSINTLGGGCGQSAGQSAGSGATGGGGTANNTNPGTGTSGQGYGGGSGTSNSRGGGGGGGSGAVGVNATNDTHPAGKAGNGGAGGTSSITGSSVAYGGGGGGAMADQNDVSKIGSGGTGGGGSGSAQGGNPNSTAGTANLGGGGGAGRSSASSSGGSGVVIIRYDQTAV